MAAYILLISLSDTKLSIVPQLQQYRAFQIFHITGGLVPESRQSLFQADPESSKAKGLFGKTNLPGFCFQVTFKEKRHFNMTPAGFSS